MSTLEPQLATPRKRSRLRLLVRMLLACVFVVVAVAGTVATGALLEVNTFLGALHHNPPLVIPGLSKVGVGKPQTLLLIGSDKRVKTAVDGTSPAHSDTMILVRIDPSQSDTTMLSVPRDLKVTIHPDHGPASTQKINAAYSLGGSKLTVKTIKQVLGIQINHVVDINFAGFKALVDYLGCVYTQVDRRYYHSNIGLPPSETYDEINIEPGYQKLCGGDALHYVRYRHADTDLVRSARQQDFIRDIKSQVGTSGLITRRVALYKIFGKYASTDIHSQDDVLKLLDLIVESLSHPIRQVQFNATLGPSYVTASPAQIQQTANAFLHGGQLTHVNVSGRHRKHQTNVPLSPETADELAGAQTLASSVPFKTYYPVNRVTAAGALPDETRSYTLDGHPAYVVVVAQGGLGQYYDLEGTTWTTAPILRSPSQTVTIGGRTMQLYFEGQHLRLIAWHDGPAVYWLDNTLQDILSNRQMLAIASAAKPVGSPLKTITVETQ
jgi:LCP family protein required for cell wall assembly